MWVNEVIPGDCRMLPHSVAELIRNHVTLELEGIDRLYLNSYVPSLQTEGGFVHFVRQHPGFSWLHPR